MYKLNISILIIIIIIASCHIHNYSSKEYLNANKVLNTCDSFQYFINQNWVYNTESNTYKYSPQFSQDFKIGEEYKSKYWKCISQLDTNVFMKIFGNPNKVDKNVLIYYLNNKCIKSMVNSSCEYLTFTFDSIGYYKTASQTVVIVNQ